MDPARRAFLLVVGALVACGGSSAKEAPGTASLQGTIRGQSFAPRDAISAAVQLPSTSGAKGTAAIVLSGSPGLCAQAAASGEPKSTQFVLIYLQDQRAGEIIAPTGPADFPAGDATSPRKAMVTAFTLDAQCVDLPQYDATAVSGTVRLTDVTNGAYAGTFDLRLRGSGQSETEHVTGAFDASACPAVATLVTQGGACR